MGANIGTTITGQLIALDVGAIAPLFAFIGVAMIVFLKKQKLHHFGKIIAGLGVLFIGMDMMSAAMMPLRESEAFIYADDPVLQPGSGHPGRCNLHRHHPVLLRLGRYPAGAGLQRRYRPSAARCYVLFGQNIGTCITAVLAAIGTSRNAKRTTIIHLILQHHRHHCLHHHLHGNAIWFSLMECLTPQRHRRSDCQHPHHLQHRHHPAAAATGQLAGKAGRAASCPTSAEEKEDEHAPGVL